MPPARLLRAAALPAILVLAACTRPDQQVATLQRQIGDLEGKVAALERQRAAAQAPAHGPADPRQEPQAALNLLVAGNAAFAAGRARPAELGPGRRTELTHGQKPFATVIGCADSRVPPEHLFSAGLGDVFVIRCAGNVVDEMAVASTEYAAAHLGTRLVVVLGHSACGAVKAACAGASDTPAVSALVGRIQPAVAEARSAGAAMPELAERAAAAHARRQKSELLARSALLRGMADDRQLRVLSARYHLDTGMVEWLDADGLDAGAAQPVRAAEAAAPPPAAPVPVPAPRSPAPHH